MEKKITLKDQIINTISNLQIDEPASAMEIKILCESAPTPVTASIDTVRKAIRRLLDLNELELIQVGEFSVKYRTRQTIEQEDAEYEAYQKSLLEERKEIERLTERTRFDKNWKLRTVRQVLLAEKVVARHEMAAIIGSDIKNTHMMVTFLKNGQTKYPAMNIEYNKKTREYKLVETQE